MDVQQLRSFRSVVAAGSVRGAAEIMGYSPSAVSQQIAALQRSAGVPLLARVGRGVEPTAAGRALASRIDGLLGELGDLDAFVTGLRQGRTGTFTLAYFSSLGTTWLPLIVGPLVREFSDTRLDLQISDVFDPARRPRADAQVLVLPTGFAPPDTHDLHAVADDPYVVVAPQGHAAVEADAVPLASLAGEAWIDNDVDQGWCRRVTVEACAAAGFQPSYRVQTHDYATAMSLVATGLGITVVPSIAARSMPEGLVARPLVQPTPVRSIGVLVLRETADRPVSRRAVELVHAAAAQLSTPAPAQQAGPPAAAEVGD